MFVPLTPCVFNLLNGFYLQTETFVTRFREMLQRVIVRVEDGGWGHNKKRRSSCPGITGDIGVMVRVSDVDPPLSVRRTDNFST